MKHLLSTCLLLNLLLCTSIWGMDHLKSLPNNLYKQIERSVICHWDDKSVEVVASMWVARLSEYGMDINDIIKLIKSIRIDYVFNNSEQYFTRILPKRTAPVTETENASKKLKQNNKEKNVCESLVNEHEQNIEDNSVNPKINSEEDQGKPWTQTQKDIVAQYIKKYPHHSHTSLAQILYDECLIKRTQAAIKSMISRMKKQNK